MFSILISCAESNDTLQYDLPVNTENKIVVSIEETILINHSIE